MDGEGVKQLLPAGMQTQFTLCGRTALELVIRDVMPIRSVYLPSYCCHTMIEPFVAKGIQVMFYNVFFTATGIGWNFDENHGCDLVFLMDYFGFRNEATFRLARRQKAAGKLVVYDTTHAMFCRDMDYSACDYVFGSFRKWFGANIGFCAKKDPWKNFPELTQNVGYCITRNTAFAHKAQFMAGESVDKGLFLEAFSRAEESLETDYVGYAPDGQSMEILQKVNVEYIQKKRRENAAFAIEQIGRMASPVFCSPYKQVQEGECPLFVPLQVVSACRTDLRQLLIENRVYLPIHWPLSDLHNTNDVSKQIYTTELSFVCDQRYDSDDIERAIQIIRSF